MSINNRTTNIIVVSLLSLMFLQAFFSMIGDSNTMDELAHTPAGYSYLSQKDFRINPEHPPLIKDIAALPLLFLNLDFPKDHPSWTDEVNSQWWLGNEFLFKSGNDPDQIVFWARIPMILILLLLGWFLFKFTKDFFDKETALLVLAIFAFSPTFLAHGRLVTTDIGASLGVIVATYFWLRFLEKPDRKNIILAGIFFGFALLLKFSLVLLIPFFAIITLTKILLSEKKDRLKLFLKYLGSASVAGLIALIFIIWPVYQFHVLNYPPQRQLSDTIDILESSPMGSLKDLCIWMSDKSGIRAIGHYFLGLLMATQRAASGNTVYFMGMVTASSWRYYFPVVYFLKVPLAFHILTLLVLLIGISRIKKSFWTGTKEWIRSHFVEFSMIIFLCIYWAASIMGNLNIGVRHVLPTFPFIYILVSLGTIRIARSIKKEPFKKAFIAILAVLFLWYLWSSLSCFPYYLSYFNELGGGTRGGYKYVVDSNFDWGQDLKRLKKYVEDEKIDKIKVDYFGGSDVEYYLGDKFERFDPKSGPQKGWIAISATLLQGGRGEPIKGFDGPTGYYDWLDRYEPKARAGTSIFIYYIE